MLVTSDNERVKICHKFFVLVRSSEVRVVENDLVLSASRPDRKKNRNEINTAKASKPESQQDAVIAGDSPWRVRW